MRYTRLSPAIRWAELVQASKASARGDQCKYDSWHSDKVD
jgi:hypothetical protein